jgi:hypothetical protein
MKVSQSRPRRFLEADHRPVIDGIVKRIERVPLLNIAGGIIQDYQYLWENYYFPSISLHRMNGADRSCVDVRNLVFVVSG